MDARHLLPKDEGLLASGAILGSGQPVTAEAKPVVDRAMGGENAPGMAGGLEPAPLPLPLSSRRVGPFGTVIQPWVLAVRNPGNPFFSGGLVGLERIGDDDPRDIAQSLEELAEETQGGALVVARLNPVVQHGNRPDPLRARGKNAGR